MCESREYQYVLPVYALRRAAVAVDETGERLGDSAGAEARRREEGLTAEERARLLSYLQQLEGTHYFHNFTDHKLTCKDKQAQRYLLSARVVDVPPLNGTACVSLCYHGQSFLLHQIRKMTSVVVGCMRGDLPPDALGVALSTPSLRSGIPLAPACALTLRRCFFPRYEKWYGERGSIHFERCAAAQDEFLHQRIYPYLAEQEAAGAFREFTESLERFRLEPRPPRADVEDSAGTADGDAVGRASDPSADSGADGGTVGPDVGDEATLSLASDGAPCDAR